MAIAVLKDTADIRAKLLEVWRLVDAKAISATEARLHISLARALLETLKVEMTFAHLSQTTIPSVPLMGGATRPALRIREQ